jgi:hypothetical protein
MKSPSSTSREQPIRPSASRLAGGFFFGASHDEYRSSQGCERASLGKYAHAGRTHQETGKRPVPWRFIAVVSERDAIT